MEFDVEKMSATELWEYAESLRDNGDCEQAAKYMKKAASFALGCKVNQYESEAIAELFAEKE